LGGINLGQGCPSCRESHGELAVAGYLEAAGIPFEREARLIHNKRYKFDFQLRDILSSTIIEYNGRQHYKEIPLWNKRGGLAGVRRRDLFKSRWARRNGYRLIVIKYTVPDVAKFLDAHLPLKKKRAA
jgi:hypothetical protein